MGRSKTALVQEMEEERAVCSEPSAVRARFKVALRRSGRLTAFLGFLLLLQTPLLEPSLAAEAMPQSDFRALMDDARRLQLDLSKATTDGDQGEALRLRNELGQVLLQLGGQMSDATILKEAIDVLRGALGLAREQRDDLVLAMTQLNLAQAMMTSIAVTKDRDLVEEAFKLYRSALEILDRSGENELSTSARERFEPLLRQNLAEPSVSSDGDVIARSEPNFRTNVTDPGFELALFGSLQVSAVTGPDEVLERDGNGDGFALSVDPEVELAANYQTEQGLYYGADVSFDVDNISASTSLLHIAGAFGELRFGRDSGAEDDIYVGGGDAQAGTGGIDGDAVNLVSVGLTGSDDATKVSYYTPRRRGFQIGASFTPDSAADSDGSIDADILEDGTGRFQDHLGLGVNWVANLMGADVIAAAVGSFGNAVEGDDLSSYSIGGLVNLGRWNLGAGYTTETSFNDRELLNLGVTYGFDPWFAGFGKSRLGAGIALQFPENAPDSTVLALSADMNIAEGLTLLGDLAYNRRDTQLDDERSSLSSVLTIEMAY